MADQFTPDDVAALRDRLADAREETMRRIAGLTRDFDAIVASAEGSSTDDEHDPEGQTIGFERAQVSALLTEATAGLADLDRAEARLTAGSYGRCDICGTPITFERLSAAPTTMACIDCAHVAERTRRRASGRDR